MASRLKAAQVFAVMGYAEEFVCQDEKAGVFRAELTSADTRTEAREHAVYFLNAHGWGTRWDALLQAFPELTRVHFEIPTRKGGGLTGLASREAVRRIWEMGQRYSKRYGSYEEKRGNLEVARLQGKLTDRELSEHTKPIDAEQRRFVLDLWEQVKPDLDSWEWR